LLIFFGFDPIVAARILLSIAGAVSGMCLHLVYRAIGLQRHDSILAHLAFLSSSAFIFWFGLIETFPLPAPPISFMIWIAAVTPRIWVWIVGTAATLAINTTNWSLGLLASYFGNNRIRFIVINACAFFLVFFLAVVQKRLMPSSGLFFSP